MANIPVSKVAEVLKKQQLDPAVLRRVIEELNLAAQPDPSDEDKPPAVKKQYVFLTSDPESRLPKTDFAGWVLQLPEDESVVSTQERICKAAYEYNRSRKGRMYPAKSIAEAIENIPAKRFAEVGLWIRTKVPVILIKTDNVLPKE